jgi:hypothetical protein
MNKETKTVYLLIYLIAFIGVMIFTSNDVSKLTGGILLSILFGVGGTLVDRDISRIKEENDKLDLLNDLIKSRIKQEEQRGELFDKLIKTSKKTRDSFK